MNCDTHSADLNRVYTKRITLTATDNPLLQIAARDNATAGASSAAPFGTATVTPNRYRNIQIAHASSSASKLIVAINYGPTSASYVQYQFSAGAAVAEIGTSSATSVVHTQVTTLGALVAALRAMLGGNAVQAYRLDGSADMSLDAATFGDLAITDLPVPASPLWCLYRSTAVLTTSGRIGLPAMFDAALLKLVRVEAVATFASGTATVTIAQDSNDLANEEKTLLSDASLVTATRKALYDFSVRPLTVQGPLMAKLVSSAVAPTAVELLVMYQLASV